MKNLRCNLLGINKHFENSFGGLLKNIKNVVVYMKILKLFQRNLSFTA